MIPLPNATTMAFYLPAGTGAEIQIGEMRRCSICGAVGTRIERLLVGLVSSRMTKSWYSTEEFAQIVGKAEFTVREYARHGRIRASKCACGRGRAKQWTISHEELERYQNFGLLPLASQGVA